MRDFLCIRRQECSVRDSLNTLPRLIRNGSNYFLFPQNGSGLICYLSSQIKIE